MVDVRLLKSAISGQGAMSVQARLEEVFIVHALPKERCRCNHVCLECVIVWTLWGAIEKASVSKHPMQLVKLLLKSR